MTEEKWTRVKKFIKNGDYYVAHCGTEKDAETIFRAVNCHDELVEVVDTCITALDASRGNGTFPDFETWEKTARAVLARAKASHGAGT